MYDHKNNQNGGLDNMSLIYDINIDDKLSLRCLLNNAPTDLSQLVTKVSGMFLPRVTGCFSLFPIKARFLNPSTVYVPNLRLSLVIWTLPTLFLAIKFCASGIVMWIFSNEIILWLDVIGLNCKWNLSTIAVVSTL